MKTKVIIALTNKSKEDFSEDDSLEALTQRFAITSKVEWPSYTKKDWRMLFDKVFGHEFVAKNKYKLSELVEILDQNHLAQKSFCSPRTAVHAAELYCYGGDLKLISDIDKDILAKFYRENKDREADEKDQKIFDLVDLYIKDNKLQDNDIVSDLLALVINEHKARTKEDIIFDEETENSRLTKSSKLDFAAAVLSLHGFAAKNTKLATDKIKFYRDEANKFKNKK